MHPKPAITSPVMRVIGVADAARSIAFYRDVLGFNIRERDGGTEALYGPARIRFGDDDYDPGEWDNPRPRGSAMLFFETADVTAMHLAIRDRGGNPSGIEKINWIKMRMFEIRDPDGHAIWFGQSYNEPDATSATRRLLQKALPELPFDDVPAAIAYYRDALGFTINYQQDDLGVIYRDDVTVLLIARTESHKGIGSFEVYVEDADALHAELSAKRARVQGEPVSRPWGLRDFAVLDLEGNRITFAQPFE
jgi:catechol 2,3-dioxygenase-like lactoylglutathione lyase family enzyme